MQISTYGLGGLVWEFQLKSRCKIFLLTLINTPVTVSLYFKDGHIRIKFTWFGKRCTAMPKFEKTN